MAPGTEKVAPPTVPTTVPNNELGCIKCGRGVSESDAFCIYCGTKVSESLAAAATKNPKQAEAPPPPPPKSAAQGKAPPPAPKSANKAESSKTPPGEETTSGKTVAPPVPVSRQPSSSGVSAAARKNEQQVSRPPSTNAAPSTTSAPASTPAPPTSRVPTPPIERSQSDRGNLPTNPRPPRTTPREDISRSSFDTSDVSECEKLWVPDTFSTDCMDCHIPFKFGKRRHHCRVCGLLFCRECVRYKTQVPLSFGYGMVPQRCCRNCVTSLQMKAITSPADVFAQRRNSKKTGTPSTPSNPYLVLGLSPNASPEEITRQYQLLSQTDDTEQLEQIKQSYRMLQDPVARQQSAHARESVESDSNDSFLAETARSDQTECQVCFRPFKLGRRQHHCRRCTRSVCTTCSEGQKPIEELGFPQPVRHCNTCMETPPSFILPTMDSIAKPPAGFEYLSKLDIYVSVTSTSEEEEGLYQVKTYCEPNADAVQSVQYALTDSDRQVANDYSITMTRSYADFEWLLTTMGACFNAKALPNFPDKRQSRSKGAMGLQTFLYGCMIHPLLRDVDGLKAFLALPTEAFQSFKRMEIKQQKMYTTDKYNSLVTSLRLEFEKAQIRNKVEALVVREKAHAERMRQQKSRSAAHEKRETAQNIRREQALTRFNALTARQTSQTERMAREKDRYEQQINTTHLLYFDTVRDQASRKTEEEVRLKEKVEFTKSKDAFQADTSEWNRDMALWSTHRANWSEAHNPPISKDIASEWIVQSYGIYRNENDTEDVPRELIELHNQLIKMQAKEPLLLEQEGNAVDEEWSKLAKEREHWTNDRANMKREDEMCRDEDVRYEQEHEFVRLGNEARAKKVQAIEADLVALKTEITSRTHCITQRRTRHEALHSEFEQEWKVIQSERTKTTQQRLEAYTERIRRCTKRNEIFTDQLARQEKSQRMLLFKRAAMTEERKNDHKVFEEHQEDCRTVLEEARTSRVLTPEYIARMEADTKIRAMEHQAVLDSNRRTAFEGGDEDVNEADEFMNDVRRRREQFQKELNDQMIQLEAENKLCTSLLEEMEVFLKALDLEMELATKEEQLISEFTTLMTSERKLLSEEEAKREEKKSLITGLINTSGNWVLDALHDHSKRKKKEADRLVQQALRAADLQKLVQHFTHRVIEQEERIMRQKQRILNGEHKVEMLKSSENWFQFVTGYTTDLSKKDLKLLDACITERMDDLKEASRLQKDDEYDMRSVISELNTSRRVSKEKEEKRLIWAQIEEAYSLTKAQEKDEDMMMTSQLRSLLQQLGEAFEMLSNRLIEEEESLQHASTQLEGEVESINAFMQRMESEGSALCNTEKLSLAKEQQVRRTECDLIEQRARSLIDTYRQMKTEHAKYSEELEKIKNRRRERERPVSAREAEMEMAKKLIKTRNYYDRKACAEYAKKFKIDNEMKQVRDVFEWLKMGLDRDIKKMEKWMEASRKERKQMESVNVKANEIDWTKDTLARIPALKDVVKKLSRSQSSSSVDRSSDSNGVHPSEQWIVDLITLKKNISEVDAMVIENAKQAIDSAIVEETNVTATLQTMKTDREYVLNSIRFIDQEEAKAVRGVPRTVSRRTDAESSAVGSNDNETKEASPSSAEPSPPKSKSARPVAPISNSRGPSSSRLRGPNSAPRTGSPSVARAASPQNATRHSPTNAFAKPQSADV